MVPDIVKVIYYRLLTQFYIQFSFAADKEYTASALWQTEMLCIQYYIIDIPVFMLSKKIQYKRKCVTFIMLNNISDVFQYNKFRFFFFQQFMDTEQYFTTLILKS